MDTKRVKVFLNHASEDKPLVRKLYHQLKKQAWLDPWLDEEEILPGQDWEFEINKALEDSDAVIICLSKTSIAKVGVVQAEIHKAQELQKRRPEGYVFMIPVLLEKCQVPSRLNSLHWVDVSVPENISRITKSLEQLRQTSDRSPAAAEPVPGRESDRGEADASTSRAASKPKKSRQGSGFQIGGNVQITNGDLVTGDKTITVGQGAVFAGGNIENSNIVTGHHNRVGGGEDPREVFFAELLQRIDQRPHTSGEDREDLKANVAEIQAEAARGNDADEPFLARRIRNIKRIAPDIAEVLLTTLVNPAAGFAVLVRRVAERARVSADPG